MRLIDADALSDLLVEIYEKAPTEKALLFVALLLKNNEQVPTFEERPHGKWLIDKSRNCEWFCSICLHGSDLHENFCSSCGADMRKGDES